MQAREEAPALSQTFKTSRGRRPYAATMNTWLLGASAALACVAVADGGKPWRMLLGALALGVAACGTLVAVVTRGRHQGGTALLAAAVLIVLGMRQGAGA